MPSTDIDLVGDEPLARARAMLDAGDIDPERIRRVRVVVEYDEREREPGEYGAGAAGPDPEPEPSEDQREPDDKGSPEVERGPVEPDPTRTGGGGGSGDPSAAYKGPKWEGAVTPASNRGVVMRNIIDGGWYDRHEAAEDTGLTPDQAGRAMSAMFREKGYLERREKDPQPDERGVHREYRITDAGRTAIEQGIRRARARHDEPDFVDESTGEGETRCGNCGEEHSAAYTRCPRCGTPA